MPDDKPDDTPAAQIAWGLQYIKDHYGAPQGTEVTCAGGITIRPIAASDTGAE